MSVAGNSTPLTVIVNASTIVKGGGIQVAASFIAETLRNDSSICWHYCVSSEVLRELKALGADLPSHHLFEQTPSRSRNQRRRLERLEDTLAPDAVFTVFGPAYVRFKSAHLCGVAAGWVTHSSRLAYRALPGWLSRFRRFSLCVYKGLWLRSADRWVVEATNAKAGMIRRVGVDESTVAVVPNTCAALFRETPTDNATPPQHGDTVRLLYVAAWYPHKNLELIPAVAAELQRIDGNLSYEFCITLPESEPALGQIRDKAKRLGVEANIVNAGPVSLAEALKLYREASICFMPSLLETFSANYPEAMATGRPIVTSDLDFAHAACGDAAVYFKPDNAQSAASAIRDLANDPTRWQKQVAKGTARLSQLPDARDRHDQYVQLIREMVAKNRTK